jgi:AcrR family transcriptional regulator
MAAKTKERIVDSTAELFRRQGYTATGVKQIVEQANAPFGSLYHFFPGGKSELAEEVIRSSGALYIELFATIALASEDVCGTVSDFFFAAAQTLSESNYTDACPIATIALEVASTNEQLRKATADVFDSWINAASAYFCASGIGAERARELAISMLCLLEGAFLFARAMRSTEPIKIAGEAATKAVDEALAARAQNS